MSGDAPLENPDGSITFDLGDGSSSDPRLPAAHDDNLALHMDQQALTSLGIELIQLFDEDKMSRAEWERGLVKGLDSLGVKHEQRTTPWDGAFSAHHPLLTEAVVRFQSNCIMEIFPSEAGPVKTKILGEMNADKLAQATRVEDHMNDLLTERMPDYRLETEKLLFGLAVSGAAFRKIYRDPITKVPAAVYIPSEDFVIPYGSSSLHNAPRYTEIQKVSRQEVRQRQITGLRIIRKQAS